MLLKDHCFFCNSDYPIQLLFYRHLQRLVRLCFIVRAVFLTLRSGLQHTSVFKSQSHGSQLLWPMFRPGVFPRICPAGQAGRLRAPHRASALTPPRWRWKFLAWAPPGSCPPRGLSAPVRCLRCLSLGFLPPSSHTCTMNGRHFPKIIFLFWFLAELDRSPHGSGSPTPQLLLDPIMPFLIKNNKC